MNNNSKRILQRLICSYAQVAEEEIEKALNTINIYDLLDYPADYFDGVTEEIQNRFKEVASVLRGELNLNQDNSESVEAEEQEH